MEKDLNEVAAGIEPFVVSASATASRIGRYHRLHPTRTDRRDDSVSIIAGIGDTNRSDSVFDQRFGKRRLMSVTSGQRDEERSTARIDDRMKLGRETTSRVPQCIGAGPPFAPDAS